MRRLSAALFVGLAMLGVWLSFSLQWRDKPSQTYGSPSETPGVVRQPAEGHGSVRDGVRAKRNPRQKLSDWTPTPEEVRAEEETIAVFYGKVLDQYDKPIPDVPVKYSAPINDTMRPRWETMTEEDGSFMVAQENAPALSISIGPPYGYENMGQSGTTVWFAEVPPSIPPDWRAHRTKPHRADPESPVVFRLKKMGRLEPLLYRKVSFKPKNTYVREFRLGTQEPHTLRLDLLVEPKTLVFRPGSPKAYFDWHVELTVPGGGIQERARESDHEAPTEGYREKIRFEFTSTMEADDFANFTSTRDEAYARFSDGTYARFDFSISIGGPVTRQGFVLEERINFGLMESYFNPSGSTATAHDPKLEIKVKEGKD